MIDKEQAKKEFNTWSHMIIIAIIVFSVSAILFSVIAWYLKLLDTKENPEDPKNAPAAVRNYMNDTTIDENGKITAGKSIQELWDEMVQTGNRATAYLNSAEELGRLIYAARALEYPDTRENPDQAINWDKLDINSKEIQGIVKFKRALADGKNISMTYVSPTKFQELVSKYQISGDEKDRQEALKHFTIEKVSANSNGTSSMEGKVPSLKDMVFIGDSILYCLAEKNDILKNEGAKFMYRGGCTANYFLGKETADGLTNNCIEKNGYFDWEANFNGITNPTGFYLVLGQNFYGSDDRIDQMNELVEKIRKQYPTPPIFINSVLNTTEKGSEELATRMNEELKTYCSQKSNVYYSDVLSGFKEKITELADNEGGIYDHPNAKGSEVLVKNIKANIIGSSSSLEEILKYACSWVGKIPYKSSVTNNDPNGERWMDLAEGRGSDCSHFIHKVFAHFGIFENTDDFFSNNVRSQHWGQGKIPGGEEIGTDLKKASPGDVIWQDFGGGWHVQIYLGDHKVVECTADNNYEGVRITKISDNHKIDQIVHLKQFPTDPTAYFDPETGILHGSNSASASTTTSASTSYGGTSSTAGTSSSTGTSSNSGTVTGQMIVQEAEKYVGKLPYVWGGSSLETGADCSGFAWAILKKLGLINWGRTNDAGFQDKGTEVSDISQAQPGDILRFNGHIAIYKGDGYMVEALNSRVGITNTRKVTDDSRPVIAIRRFTNDAGASSIVASTPEEIAKIPRAYNNDVFNVDENKWVDPMLKMDPPYNNGSEDREYRAIQSTCFDGKYAVSAQNKNYGSIDASSNGGRIIWSNLETGEIDYIVQTSEGGHMGEGITYDSDRNMIIFHTGGGDLLEIDNNTKSISGHSKTSEYPGIITYLSTTKQLVGVTESEFTFFKYDASKNEYVKQNSVKIDNFRINELFQGIGNDGQCIYVFDSKVGNDNGNNRVWVYSLDGKLQEEHPLGSGFPRAKEIESGFADNEGNLWIGTNHSLVKVLNYKANPANVNPGSSSSSSVANMTYQVKVATWSEVTDGLQSDDPDVPGYPERTTYSMTTTAIPYQAIVSKYRMPFNYLWTMLVYSNDKDYTFDLADLVKNSKIEITIHDNLNETTNIVTDTYTDYTKIHAEADVNIEFNRIDQVIDKNINPITKKTTYTKRDVKVSDSTTEHGAGDGSTSVSYTVVHKTITKTNTLDIALTLADAWCTKYEKKYTYNKPHTTESNSSTTLGDIPEDPHTSKGELGGQEEKVNQDAINNASASNRTDFKVTGYENEFATYQTTRINRVKNTYTEITSSSYFSAGGTNLDRSTISSVSTPKTGSLNKDNYVDLLMPKSDGDEHNPIQGFCLVGDNLIAYVINHKTNPETCTLYLADLNTMEEYDHYDDLEDHGNSIAYDSQTGDIIFPEVTTMKLLRVNQSPKKFENPSTMSLPIYANDTPSIAYNATHDVFISHKNIYTRQAFYSGGEPFKKVEYNKLGGDHLNAGCTSYGNQIYYYFAEGYGHSKNYFIVCNISTGQQEEILRDDMAREGEEASFSSDGTLFICHSESGPPFCKTDYNYYSDNNIDKSNVSVNGNSITNEIARYNTGGTYSPKSSFEDVFNSHYNARSNILSATGWLLDALSKNSDTEKMVELTQYLLHKATGNDYGEYGNKEFNFEEYDPGGFTQIGAGGLEGNTTEERVWLALINAGFNDVAAAAAMGNLSYESGGSSTKTIKTDVVEGGYNENNGGIGMCQWTNGNRGTEGRNTQLKKYAQSKGTTWKDEKTQIEFLITEITGEGSAKGYAHLQFMKKTYDGVTYPIDALKTVENNQSQIEYATKAFAATFERPAASAFTNSMSKRVELANYFYSQFNGKRSASTGNGNIMKTCEEVMQIYLSRDTEYSIQRSGEGKLIYGNIEKCVNEAKYACCATYTSSVLYKSGLLTADQINKYNYHYTGKGGIPDMLQAAGWSQVNMSEIKEGDVVVDYGVHVLIYAGGDNYYDNRTCIHGSSYGGYYQATKSVRSGFSYYRNKNVQIWRAPGK